MIRNYFIINILKKRGHFPKPMEYLFKSVSECDFRVALKDFTLEFMLLTKYDDCTKFYKTSLTEENIPSKLKKQFPNINKLFHVFDDDKNFFVQFLKG